VDVMAYLQDARARGPAPLSKRVPWATWMGQVYTPACAAHDLCVCMQP